MDMSEADALIPRLPVDEEQHCYLDWEIVYQKSHILHSMCTNEYRCVAGQPDCCELCFYEGTLNLPHLPEMVFPKNRLRLRHRPTGAQIEFNALDALRLVSSNPDATSLQQVSCAEEWQESRPHAQLAQQQQLATTTTTTTTTTDGAAKSDGGGGSSSSSGGEVPATAATGKVRPYDWTYSTNYQGTLSPQCRLEPTDDRLNMVKLTRQERIHFYHDLTLFEDELHDHGIASSSVKIRVMQSGFFILLRYFLRIDNVMVRINDTRYHFEREHNYILKEYTSKEAHVQQLKHVPLSSFTVPGEIEKHLPVLQRSYEKLFFDGGPAVNGKPHEAVASAAVVDDGINATTTV